MQLTFSIVAGVLVVGFLIFATKRKWISWKGGRGIASVTAFHDLQTEDKQNAIEYVIEDKAGNKMKEQESGEKK